ncbi:ABC transporter permease [Brevibacterium yomogidense]|uniref:ABC transporter permease n=1 Tax=Brevibacterium yomogidense TaxID=946573 RepID=UPI0018E04967|nr:ABC transporter permease [Brevibacterium yomogidense]
MRITPTAVLILRRLGHGAIVLWAAYTLSFLVLFVLPGDPVAIILGGADQSTATPEQIQAVREEHHLDRPFLVQYALALSGALRLDFGTSYATGMPVVQAIVQSLPSTLGLATAALALAVVGGTALAIIAVRTQRPTLRNILAGLPGLGVAMPTFWVGLLLLQVFSFRLGWIPALGADGFLGLVLPAITLALPLGAMIGQVLLTALDRAWAEQFVTTFRAAGLARTRLLLTHALRVASLSLLSIAGVLTGNLLSGAVVVETVFTRNGLGRLAESAVSSQDIPLVQGIVVFSALVFVVVNLVTDLLYPLVDPRTRPAARPSSRRTARPVAPTAAQEVSA